MTTTTAVNWTREETLGERAGHDGERWDARMGGNLYVILRSDNDLWQASAAPIGQDGLARGYRAVAGGRSFRTLSEAQEACELTATSLLSTPHEHFGQTWECSRCGEAGGTFCWGCIAIHNTAMHSERRAAELPIDSA